jgi:hypothetical protein
VGSPTLARSLLRDAALEDGRSPLSFKEAFVATENRDEWQLPGDEIGAWLQSPHIQARLAELAQEEEELAGIRRLEVVRL